MKMKFKRFLSGVMAVATLASVIVQPIAVSASELEPEEIPFEQQYPELKEVQDSLDPDEIVTANDIEIAYGDEFEVEVDLSGIDGVDESKMKILFHEAKNEAGAEFDTHTPDTYKAVYAVEPVSGHPSYRISRNITVKESETETQSESSSEIAVDDDSGTGDTEQSDDDSESHQENTVDTETELTVSEVLEQAETNGIDLYAMDAGETVTFMASAGNARSSQQVSVTRGTMYRYADYGYGSYLTYQYTVKFGKSSVFDNLNSWATAAGENIWTVFLSVVFTEIISRCFTRDICYDIQFDDFLFSRCNLRFAFCFWNVRISILSEFVDPSVQCICRNAFLLAPLIIGKSAISTFQY